MAAQQVQRDKLGGIPDRHQPIVAAGGNLRAVRTPGHIGHGAREALPLADALPRDHVPDLHTVIFVRSVQRAAVGRKGQRAHRRHRSGERHALLALLHVPDPEGAVQLAQRQIAAIGTPRQPHQARGDGYGLLDRAARGVPELDRSIPRCAGQRAAIGGERQSAHRAAVPVEGLGWCELEPRRVGFRRRPQADAAVMARGDEKLAIRTPNNTEHRACVFVQRLQQGAADPIPQTNLTFGSAADQGAAVG